MEKQPVIRRIQSFIDRYFFSRSNLLPVGILRIFMVFYFAQRFVGQGFARFQESPLTALHERSPITGFLGSFLFFPGAEIVFSISAFLALVGLFTRPALFVFGLYIIAITGISASMGVFDHLWSLASQVILILAFIPGSTNLSADRALSWFWAYRKSHKPALNKLFTNPSDLVWGMRLLLMLLACVYLTAGISKLRYGGLKWMDGNTLTHYLDGSASSVNGHKPPIYLSSNKVSEGERWKDGFGLYGYSYGNRQTSAVALRTGKFMTSIPGLVMALAILTVLFELSGFLLLFDRLPRTLFLFGALILHTAIGFLMGLGFIPYRIICLLFLDWPWIASKVTALRGRAETAKPELKDVAVPDLKIHEEN
jgi:hypothetical protein